MKISNKTLLTLMDILLIIIMLSGLAISFGLKKPMPIEDINAIAIAGVGVGGYSFFHRIYDRLEVSEDINTETS